MRLLVIHVQLNMVLCQDLVQIKMKNLSLLSVLAG